MKSEYLKKINHKSYNMNTLPGKTVERLSEYRRTLLGCLNEKRNFIFSHDLASLLHINAVAGYFKGKRSKLNLVASFDNDPQKINKVISGVRCYPYHEMEKVINELNIKIAILTVPVDYAKEIAEETVRFGIKRILNYTTVPLNVPSGVYLEEYDMITSIEKVAYFVKENKY